MKPALLSIFLVACAPCGALSDVSVSGGSFEQQVLVRAGLQRFASETGRSELCVAKVSIEKDPRSKGRESLGRYQSLRKRIILRAHQADLGLTLQHELCHALDLQEGISASSPESFPYDPKASDYDIRDEDSRAREAFALMCELGATEVRALRETAEHCRAPDAVGLALVDERVFSEPQTETRGASTTRLPSGFDLARCR